MPANLFRNEDGAIDLSSIMVGVIVIGLIIGVIAATVFAVVPWSQDSAAKQQLDSLNQAENAYMGLSSTSGSSSLPAGTAPNSFGTSSQLDSAALMKSGASYCVSVDSGLKNYTAFSQSSTGKVWYTTNQNTSPAIYTGNLPSSCYFITSSVAHSDNAGYVDPNPTQTIMTFKCDADTTSYMPFLGNLNGTETWSDGFTNTYTNSSATPPSHTLHAGQTDTLTFNGTYNMVWLGNGSLAKCLRSVDHWGLKSGVTNANEAFWGASNLTSVPDHIPTTITNMSEMFRGATAINDPNISQWDVSNVTNMAQMFNGASAFNQSLAKWDTSNVTDMSSMFSYTNAFNQPLNMWNTSKVTNMSNMFWAAFVFNQPLNNWNTGKVTNMSMMFYQSYQFGQDLSGWNVAAVTNHSSFSDMSSLTAAQLPKFLT